ncbi:hypothetical protein [Synoicihabitans lomoniglobus]|uniref:Uncharacterized protein n=1 Tax=Synoicihabitans lomoniglobus TaxID=2909285 RepID=A0AAF0CRE7_9BACT|nr:hypothetical protein [Opitutaceae bacterium LMO-M01]WED66707.1 hypothetical protein PXH66_07575 [Opitutaceae bacterium LMO-M01]
MDSLKFIAPRSAGFVDWSEAYARVEAYFYALRIQNKLLLSQLVAGILQRTAEQLEQQPDASPVTLAVEEAAARVDGWFRDVLTAAGVEPTNVRQKGRLALFLADLPARWQNEFLSPGPWPEPFLEAMKATYLTTGPDFQMARMAPASIDLGIVSTMADETWRAIDRWPFFGTVLAWSLYLAAIGIVFYLLR